MKKKYGNFSFPRKKIRFKKSLRKRLLLFVCLFVFILIFYRRGWRQLRSQTDDEVTILTSIQGGLSPPSVFCTKVFFNVQESKGILHGTSVCTPLRRSCTLENFLHPLNFHRPGPGLNPRPPDSEASALPRSHPRRLLIFIR